MFATNVRNLKKNPSEALRQAEKGPVLVLKGSEPNAIILNLKKSLAETEDALRPALAASLYQGQVVSLGAAAKISSLPLSEFIDYLAALDIDIVRSDAYNKQEKEMFEQWQNHS